jgi:ribosomal protein S7
MKKELQLKNKIHNYLMINGNKHTCEKKIVKNTKLFQKINFKNHLEILKLAIINSSPVIKMRIIKNKNKKRKTSREFPYVLNKKNRIFLGVKSIFRTSSQNLYEEFLLNAKRKSNLVKEKEASYKQALSKKKYIFFRWFF